MLHASRWAFPFVLLFVLGCGGAEEDLGASEVAGAMPSGGGGGSGGADSGTGGATTGGARGDSAAPVDAGAADGDSTVGTVSVSAIGANGTIGIEWDRVAGATGYRIYWSTTAGVTKATGQPLDSTDPAFIHRSLTNGTVYYYVVAVVTAGGEGPASAEASATPGGEWVLEQLGSGDFDDVLTGQRVPRVPIAKREHVLLLPEGYLASDLATFHDHAGHDLASPTNDVDRWLREVFTLEPYFLLREAFVVWYLPRASNTRVNATTPDTAFHTVVSGGGVTDTAGVAAPLWSVLDDQGTDAFPYPPATTVLNHVAAFLILDATRTPPRAGYSGVTTSITNPARSGQRIRCAFAMGHSHEFTHAFASVSDEYLETTRTVTNTSPTSNVAATNTCSELPWAHLLVGAGINQTDQLVGAFGRPTLGYHPELYCLMNGTHDNGAFYCTNTATSLTLRPARLCNFCRELTSYRIFERTGILSGTASYTTWGSSYRAPFYSRFGFVVPPTVPQTLTCSGEPTLAVYEACVP